MSVCNQCGQETQTGKSCTRSKILFQGKAYEPKPFGQEKNYKSGDFCPECGVGLGGYHHPGCEFEECPVCGGQFVLCFCGAE